MEGKKCNSCGFNMLNPSYSCPNCGNDSLQDVILSGDGSIYTYTVVNVGFGHLAKKAPYILAIVELTEGLKVLTIVEGGDTTKVSIGDKVKFLKWDELQEPIFQPA
jgi:uncharacterized OB-fold protein